MRGLALATLFLGLCLAKPDEAAVWLRLIIFLIAMVMICAGL
jgi:1,4-dihydroxy-2-naphthoate octaprenyltransferase